MQISGILAVITYIVDGVFKLREFRRKSRSERLATVDSDDAKIEQQPYVDEEQSVAVTTPVVDGDDVNDATTQPNTTSTN